MPNLKQNIDGHIKSILHKKIVPPRSCNNCRVKTECPMSGNCLKESVAYQAIISTEDHHPPQTYVGLTENSFKTRYLNPKSSFANANKRNNTELSKYIWCLKENLTKFKVTWRILKHASSYNPTSNRCNLCLWEKYFIICKPDLASLNTQNKLISSCRHAGKYALKNFTPCFSFLFVFQVVFCFLIAFLIASLVTPYILFFKKGGIFIGNCSTCISNSMLTVIHIRSLHLMSAAHQLCCILSSVEFLDAMFQLNGTQ